MEKINDDLEHIGDLIVSELQSIIRLNGAYRSGKLYDSFNVEVKGGETSYEIKISNDAPYAKYLSKGTRDWFGKEQSRSPVVRKYSFPKVPKGYPMQKSGYPFNNTGIEPIDFINPIKQNLGMLLEYINGAFVREYTSQIIQDFKANLEINK